MIAAEALKLSFLEFMKVTAIPAVIGLPLIWFVLIFMYKGKWHLASVDQPPSLPLPTALAHGLTTPTHSVNLDVSGTIKASLVTLAVIVAFVSTRWPHAEIALAGASILLISRHVASRDLLNSIDGNLLLLLMGLFVVNAAMSSTGLPQELLKNMRGFGLDLHDPMSLMLILALVSNIVGNNPAVMLVVPFIQGASHPQVLGAAIAVGTGFSSNLFIFSSLAGIIVAEVGRQRGVRISFTEFARAGIPLTVLSMILAVAWIAILTY
jgi:Na+/H+ antiporter NhaD/arsenite permease-like protein